MSIHFGCDLDIDGFLPDFNRMVTRIPLERVMNISRVHALMSEFLPLDPQKLTSLVGVPLLERAILYQPTVHRSADLLYPWVGHVEREDRPRCSAAHHLMASSADFGHPDTYGAFTELLRAHPNPGAIILGYGYHHFWGAFVAHGMWETRWEFVERTWHFTEVFEEAARQLGLALGLVEGKYVSIHYRFESDFRAMAASVQMTHDQLRELQMDHLTKITDRFYQNFSDIDDHLDRLITRPVYLATGLLANDPWVQRFRSRYPAVRVRTKDEVLTRLCDHVAAADSRTNFVALRSALAALPWTSDVDVCTRQHTDESSSFTNREYWAVLDLLLLKNSAIFIGAVGSTMSSMMTRWIEKSPKSWPYEQDAQKGMTARTISSYKQHGYRFGIDWG